MKTELYGLDMIPEYSGTFMSDLMDTAGVTAAKPILDELIYDSYAHNRKSAPQVSPERWARIFPNVVEMEVRYQKEINQE